MDEAIKCVKVRRGNVILSVPEYDKENYLAKGYDVLNEAGNVVEESVPNDVPTLQAKLTVLADENKRLKDEIKRLKEQQAIKSTPAKKETVVEANKPVTEPDKKPSKNSKKDK